jgi:hypothetical protein
MFTNAIHSRWTAACALALTLLGGCVIKDSDDEADDRGDSVVQKKCDDPRYGDGTCQADLACEAPDVDCFLTFDDQGKVEAWFSDFEAQLADEEGREPRAIVPSSDPRWKRMRKLLDKGWESYRRVKQVGELATSKPALVVVEDESVNAFVIPDLKTGQAGFVVVVHTATLDGDVGEGPMLGLVMHELEHAVGLHVIPGGKDRLRRFYVAKGGREPLGFEQADDPVAREHGEAWRELAGEVGPLSHEDLGPMPLSAGSDLARVLKATFAGALQRPGADEACAGAKAALAKATEVISAAVSPLDQSYAPAEPARPLVDAAFAALRDECMADGVPSFAEVIGGLFGVNPDVALDGMPERDRELIEGKHAVDAIAALVLDRRAAMRAVEAEFAERTGEPWSSLRYFSYEEAADDATVPVLRGIDDVEPDGLADFFLDSVLEGEARDACRAELGGGKVPGYGADLTDEHHATCWRVHHVRAVADAKPREGRLVTLPRSLGPARAPRPRLLPPRLSDLIVY